jgi:hypothetical protein
MADIAPCAAIGYIFTKHFDVYDQCTEFCHAKNLNYHSNFRVCENKKSFERTLFYVYLFSPSEALKVVHFMHKLGLDYVYVNIVKH